MNKKQRTAQFRRMITEKVEGNKITKSEYFQLLKGKEWVNITQVVDKEIGLNETKVNGQLLID